ncbi:LacI family transcriptional regulator [Eubacterium sp. am_0171]|uniref:LacI family DNA-binding transcriptional regulator n=1 Tax=unclassified Eubacterium (in: firmicutes) TaxID=2624479 RepID=UPI001020795D|nr:MULTISPECIES: LacI family DNA-binding transcriptional regulator [unclassified Eubacterium (in: firmicutes)]MBS6762765.1 LacI family DNA-binding transcriptional regulator [Clostridium sp.]MSC83363.1 substrate-binding domain-containing protein [Eubacterium sp. BIOML-A1]MSD05299.1 substrate-binding domain-containing protein [Eubacterium sp. BIOML-A2]RYT24956.1 LacI family transcriptional regulator [Eubacterium sp. am_0171]
MQDIVTIKDIAAKAGVAVSTVSRVINNLDRVSPKTKEKVLKAIDELGYVRNDFAASIKTGATKFIVTIVPDIVNEFYISVIRGVEKVARVRGYRTIFYTVDDGKGMHSGVLEESLERVVDGIILIQSIHNKIEAEKIGKPVVLIDREEPASDMHSVTVDNYRGACLLTQEIIDNGHSRIAFIIGDSTFNVMVERMRGFRDTLSANHIEIPDEYICIGDWQQETGEYYLEKLLELPEPPTAVFAGNNQIGFGCLKYMMDHGIVAGKDLSLAEFDDSIMAQYLEGGITCISSPMEEMGQAGARLLIDLIEHGGSANKKVMLDTKLIRRNSLAKLD